MQAKDVIGAARSVRSFNRSSEYEPALELPPTHSEDPTYSGGLTHIGGLTHSGDRTAAWLHEQRCKTYRG